MSDRKPTTRQKQFVYDRARGVCEYCLSPANYSSDYFSIEHIYPRVLGGTNSLNNLALSCQGCNSHKFTHITAIDPMTGTLAPLFHPRRDTWSAHFVWNEEYTQIIGQTPTGRATVEDLPLNREGVVNQRNLLVQANRRPPYWELFT